MKLLLRADFSAPGGLPEHASLARRLGDSVWEDGARAAPRRLTLTSVSGEPALIPLVAARFSTCPRVDEALWWHVFPRVQALKLLLRADFSAPGGLPEHASLARRLGDSVWEDGARAAPRRLTLASVSGEPALIPLVAAGFSTCPRVDEALWWHVFPRVQALKLLLRAELVRRAVSPNTLRSHGGSATAFGKMVRVLRRGA